MTTYKPNKHEPGAVSQIKRWLPLGIIIVSFTSASALLNYRMETHEKLGLHPEADKRLKVIELDHAGQVPVRSALADHLRNSEIHETNAEKKLNISNAIKPVENRLIRIEANQEQTFKALRSIERKLGVE